MYETRMKLSARSALTILATFGAPAALLACAPAKPAAAVASPAADASFKPIGEAKVGDKTHCPVSGEDFTVAADSPKVELDGKTYYFCCPGCAKKFSEDPKKFLAKPAA